MAATTFATPLELPDVSVGLHANLELSHQCLTLGTWLRSEHLPDTAQLVFGFSRGHASLAHRLARLFARNGIRPALPCLKAPQTTYELVPEAVRELSVHEARTVAAAQDATARAASFNRSLAVGLADSLADQHQLARATDLLAQAAARTAGRAPLEHWARRRRRAATTTTPIDVVSTGSPR